MLPSVKNSKDIYEKAISWFWVILFISSVLYLRWILVDMHTETIRMTEERERFKFQMEDIRDENEDFYKGLKASLEESVKFLKENKIAD